MHICKKSRIFALCLTIKTSRSGYRRQNIMEVTIVKVIGKCNHDSQSVQISYVFEKLENAIKFTQHENIYNNGKNYGSWTQTGCYIERERQPLDDWRV